MKDAIKTDAERTKIAEERSDEGYPVTYVGTQGTIFVCNIKRDENTFHLAYMLCAVFMYLLSAYFLLTGLTKNKLNSNATTYNAIVTYNTA